MADPTYNELLLSFLCLAILLYPIISFIAACLLFEEFIKLPKVIRNQVRHEGLRVKHLIHIFGIGPVFLVYSYRYLLVGLGKIGGYISYVCERIGNMRIL